MDPMPKIELHAHLNGSIRKSTLLELARVQCEEGVLVFADVQHVILKDDPSVLEFFKLFDLVHHLTTDHGIVSRVTKEVVEDFAAENTVYLELRTTPKKLESKGMTKRSYMEAVINGLRAVDAVDLHFTAACGSKEISLSTPRTNDSCNVPARRKIYVRLLLSIDRRETTTAAMETVQLALEMRHLGVVGLDLSGNPLVGQWETFLPALQFAREQGLPITLHCGEVPNPKEVRTMLDFLPQRIGHACFFQEEDWRKLRSSKIPVEICLTSNIKSKTISSIDDHPFVHLYSAKHPVVLCTDDTGVFSTSLSNEYSIAASSFGLGRREIFQLGRDAIEYSFADDGTKNDVREIFDSAMEKLGL